METRNGVKSRWALARHRFTLAALYGSRALLDALRKVINVAFGAVQGLMSVIAELLKFTVSSTAEIAKFFIWCLAAGHGLFRKPRNRR